MLGHFKSVLTLLHVVTLSYKKRYLSVFLGQLIIRALSFITERGGGGGGGEATKGREASEIYPYKQKWGWGGGKVLAVLKGVGGGGAKSVHPLKEGRLKFYAVLKGMGGGGGGTNSFGPAIFPFCSPPSLYR